MKKITKAKLIMFFAMMFFLGFYAMVFGTKNAAIGITIILAAFMSLGNDLSFKPRQSFLKIFILLAVMAFVAFLNNPISIWGCILTFILVFAVTFTSYRMFSTSTYMPYLMCYFLMMFVPVTAEQLPIRILSLLFGAVFIVGLNILINRKKDYKLSKATIDKLISEINSAVDLKLEGKTVSKDSFKTVNGFYQALLSKFEYKYFPSKKQKSVLNIVKAFQSVGYILANHDLSKSELKHLKQILSQFNQIPAEEFFKIAPESKEMSAILLNLEIISSEISNDLVDDNVLPDRREFIKSVIPLVKNMFSFKSAKFIFAFKMAFIMFLWELLTLIFNLPFTKWLYFITIPMMIPYIDDLANTAKDRIKGTFMGVFIFAILLIVAQYVPLSPVSFGLAVLVCGMLVVVMKLEDKFIMVSASTVLSVMAALMYIEPSQAMELKILWVVIGVIVVYVFNFKFLPYSVEKETDNNLRIGQKLNSKSIDLIRQKCNGNNGNDKTALMIVSNIVHENIEVSDANCELYELQIKVMDICNFILNYLEINSVSDKLKWNMVNIINNDDKIDADLNIRENIIACSMKYAMELYERERDLI